MKKHLLCGFYECKKSLFVQKGLLIVLAGLLLKLVLCSVTKPDLYEITYNTDVYKYYTEEYGGSYTEEKLASVEAELQKQQEIVTSFRGEELLSSEEYMAAYNRYCIANEKVPVLEAVKGRLTSLKGLQAYDAEFVYDLELGSYCKKFGLDWVCLICIAVLTVGIVLGDYRCGMEQLLVPSKLGKRRIGRGKLLAAVVLSGGLALLCSVLQNSILFCRWDMGNVHAPIQSYAGFESCSLNISVLEGVVLTGILQVVFSMVFALLVALFAKMVKNEVIAIVAAIVVLAVDGLLIKESGIGILSVTRWLEGLRSLGIFL